MSQHINIRAATSTDLPDLTTLLINAFAPGPWSTLLFPPTLRTDPSDEFNWRLDALAAQLGCPGHMYVAAAAAAVSDGKDGEEILGWAHWVDTAAAAAAVADQTTAATERTCAPGLDTAALARMREEGAAVEQLAREALVGERMWRRSFELHYLVVAPAHQRKGVGRLLTQELLDRAAAAGQAIWLRSTLAGREFYLTMGFEEVGELKVCGEGQFAIVKRARA